MTGEAEPTPPSYPPTWQSGTQPLAGAPGPAPVPAPPAAPSGFVAPMMPPPPPPSETWRPPRRVEAVPGTPFALVYLDVPPVISGLAIGSLVAGIGSVLVSFVVGCFGLAGAQAGWGAWAAGAFAVLAGLLGGAAIVFGLLGHRQIRRAAPQSAIRLTGRGLAVAGISCGGAGLLVTVVAFLAALLLQLA